ncbi:MAG: hypothetical protein ACYTFA_15690 [Planctomycetota bacterium]|jgi:hypothetical protein
MSASESLRWFTDGRTVVVFVHTLVVCASYYGSRSHDDMFYGPCLLVFDFPALLSWYYLAQAIECVLGETPGEILGGYYSQFCGMLVLGGVQWYLIVAIPKWVSAFRQRTMDGCCLKCRCDLTGNVTGVCPECGTKVESP